MKKLYIAAVLAASIAAPAAQATAEDAAGEEYLNAQSAQAGWVPLDIKLPTPMFVGTPLDIWTPNMEPVTNEARKPFLAPKGLENVALKKPVTGSDTQPVVGDLEQITDGDKKGVDGSFVEFAAGVQWVQVDLLAPCEIFAVLIWHYHAEARLYYDVTVRVADDPDFITNVRTLFSNDHDNSSGLGVGQDKEYIETNEGKLVDAGGAQARYIRVYSGGNTSNELNHYVEVEVFGRPAE